ncbi:MAG: adenosylcobinamide kinase [Frankiales bacterium]|nr:adenosylcobinamide kinase [Frankiales bacterium]
MPDDVTFPPVQPGESAESRGWAVLRDDDSVTVTGPDGTQLRVPLAPAAAVRPAGRVLVLGGARSGKSSYAESRVASSPAVTYVATAFPRPDDPEWTTRVATHRARRPASWRTVETTDLAGLLPEADVPVLIDCLSLWLAAHLDSDDLSTRVDDLLEAWGACRVPVVAVSSEVGAGVVPVSESGRRYRDELGRLNARFAAAADEVWLVTAGIPRRLR